MEENSKSTRKKKLISACIRGCIPQQFRLQIVYKSIDWSRGIGHEYQGTLLPVDRIQRSSHHGQHYLRRNVRQLHGNRIVRHILTAADRRALPFSPSPPTPRSCSPLLFRNFADSSPDRKIRTSSECRSAHNAPLGTARTHVSRFYFSTRKAHNRGRESYSSTE